MKQKAQAQLSKALLLERLAQSTQGVTEATLAYRQWSQVRTGCASIIARWKETPDVNSAAYETLLVTLDLSAERCAAIEGFLDKQRHMHEVWLFQLDELEHEFA